MKPITKDLPKIKEIKQLERNSQKEGSGIVYEELLGIWMFQYVWKNGSDEIDNFSSSILQVLSARLELNKKDSENNLNFEIKNSISCGLLNIIFTGSASLKGLRPLLPFYFDNFKVNIGNFSIIISQLKNLKKRKCLSSP